MDSKEIKRENVLTQYLFSKAVKKNVPLSGTFELSPVCNFSCRMCYVRKTQKEVNTSARPILTYEQWLELAKQLKDQGMLYLLLTGGEPFLWPDFWKLYPELHRMGFWISINSNGSLIDENAVKLLRKMPPAKINITLYGASDETYEALCRAKGVFSKVDRAITELKKAGILVKLNCSLTPANAGDLEKIVAYAKEKELVLQIATYMFPPLRRDMTMIGRNERFTPQEAAYYNLKKYRLQYGDERYYEYLENVIAGIESPPQSDESCIDPMDGKIRCRAGRASFWITWDGWLTPCGMMSEPKVDITRCSLEEGWKQLVEMSREIALTGLCGTCSNNKICHMCAAVAMAETGSFSGVPRYLCEERIEAKKLAEKELAELRAQAL